MRIIINGETKEFSSAMSVEELLNELKIHDRVMAVAINMEIVKKDKWSIHQINDGDKIEALEFVGGG
jgi:sulfur carrier protein